MREKLEKGRWEGNSDDFDGKFEGVGRVGSKQCGE